MTATPSPVSRVGPGPLGCPPVGAADADRWGVPVQLGQGRVLRPGRFRWLRALGWLLLLVFVTAAAFGVPLQAVVDAVPPDEPALGFLAPLVACTTALAGYALAVRLGEGRPPTELPLRPALPGLATGAGLGLLLMSALTAAMVATGLYRVALVGPVPAWTALGMACQASVTEEIWMRALLFRRMWRAFGPLPAFTVSALVFAALHLANPGANVLAGATVAVAGLMFCALYTLTGRLWVPIGLHLAWNLAQGYLFGAAVSGRGLGSSVAISTARADAPSWLTGGTFGPEASLFALVLVTTVAGAGLYLARLNGRFRGGGGLGHVGVEPGSLEEQAPAHP